MNTNPDNEIKSSTLGLFSSSLPLAALYVVLLMVLFNFKDSISFFNIILWLVFPLVVYLIGSVMNIINQLIVCKKVDSPAAFLGGIPIVISVLISMGIGSISYCRIPVVSAFAPLFFGDAIDVKSNTSNSKSNSKNNIVTAATTINSSLLKSLSPYKKKLIMGGSNCYKEMTLEQIESNMPIIKGLAIGFYVIFGVLFGNIFGNGISITC